MTDSLAIVYVRTKYDNPVELNRSIDEVLQSLEPLMKEGKLEVIVIPVDGDAVPDLSACLNRGITDAFRNNCDYVHWLHSDFTYDDPDWFLKLKFYLDTYPEIMKICASNSREVIEPMRIGQEQSWLMRVPDFYRYPWLYFDERFIRCGGCEDYYQHLQILGRGKLVLITPDCTIHHRGAASRDTYDSHPHQRQNRAIFAQINGYNEFIEVHQAKYLGCLLKPDERDWAMSQINPILLPYLKINSLPSSVTNR